MSVTRLSSVIATTSFYSTKLGLPNLQNVGFILTGLGAL